MKRDDLIALLGGFATAAVAAPVSAQGSQPLIRLGIGPSDAFSEGYYAQRMGFFKRAGLRVAITRYRTGTTIMTGVAANSIDIGISNIPNLAVEISRGTPLVLLAGGGLYTSRDVISALCVATKSPLRAAGDLVGKTVAVVAPRDQSHLGTLAWLDRNHVDYSKVNFIGLPFNEMTDGIDRGLADAALLTEPWLSEAVGSGKYRVLAEPYNAIAPEFLIGVWFTTTKWQSENHELARRFVNVIYETARWANAHHRQTAELLSQVSGVGLQTILKMKRTPYPTSLDPALIQPQLDLAYKYHAIDRALNANEIIVNGR